MLNDAVVVVGSLLSTMETGNGTKREDEWNDEHHNTDNNNNFPGLPLGFQKGCTVCAVVLKNGLHACVQQLAIAVLSAYPLTL